MIHKPICSFTSRALATISLLLLCTLGLAAQSSRPTGGKTTLSESDTIPLFRGVAVSFDLVGVGQMALGDYGQYEAAARLNLRDRYFPIIELGMGKADTSDPNTTLHYTTSAPYARLGIDFNVMKNKHDINRVYVGGRYGFTSFKYDVDGTSVNDPVWGDGVEFNYKDNSANCHWLEFVAGIDARLWGNLRLGWSVRYKRQLSKRDAPIGKAWYIPGFGRDGDRIGATFNVIFEL